MVAADVDFLNLLFAKSYFMSDASFICCDAEAGLPFRDGVFRTAFSLDCVHYIRGKSGLGRELRRIGRPDALYAIAHLHNANGLNSNPGIPLTAGGYSKVFEPLNGHIYVEAKLLESFCTTGCLSLDVAGTDASVRTSNAFIYLSLGKDMDDFPSRRLDRSIARRTGHLSLNPLYVAARVGRSLELRLQWPSPTLRDECCVDFQPLKEKVEVAPAFADLVLAHRFGDLPAETLETLIRSFTIVPQPSGRFLSRANPT
jgi:SAM-dependent methyltransferase